MYSNDFILFIILAYTENQVELLWSAARFSQRNVSVYWSIFRRTGTAHSMFILAFCCHIISLKDDLFISQDINLMQ